MVLRFLLRTQSPERFLGTGERISSDSCHASSMSFYIDWQFLSTSSQSICKVTLSK